MDQVGAPERGDGRLPVPRRRPAGAIAFHHRRRRPRWHRIALTASLALLLLLGLSVGGGFIYYRKLDSGLRRTGVLREVHDLRPAIAPGGAQNFLLLGTDSRDPGDSGGSDNSGNSGDSGGGPAQAQPQAPVETRADVIVLMHVDAAHRKAYLISVPRDLYVSVPQSATTAGSGDTPAKINTAFARGGLPLVVQTVERYTGVRVDHLVMVDFEGFKKVTDVVGGVDVTNGQEFTSIGEPYHRTFKKGTIHLNGAEALDYVRQRQQFTDGDAVRTCHQQQFVKALLDKATGTGLLGDPRALDAFLRSVTTMLTVDSGFSLADAALQFRNIRTADLTFLTSPNLGPTTVGDESVRMPDDAKAKALYDAVANDTVADWVAHNAAGPSNIEPGTCAEQ
ncbi:LytR family transcriptional regulator [Planosporangium thailandense]|uniref:LytR family transcriptional regulator n=1 Tax=Planosporangium thailandense TaxID=765197 RepID=A0ABX0Y2X6_9ACTN|nr:LCP family protein [Planosporangium thailandense]NJC72431.1 LytR family transcriptional regulator [Planosporangium thailandense]